MHARARRASKHPLLRHDFDGLQHANHGRVSECRGSVEARPKQGLAGRVTQRHTGLCLCGTAYAVHQPQRLLLVLSTAMQQSALLPCWQLRSMYVHSQVRAADWFDTNSDHRADGLCHARRSRQVPSAWHERLHDKADVQEGANARTVASTIFPSCLRLPNTFTYLRSAMPTTRHAVIRLVPVLHLLLYCSVLLVTRGCIASRPSIRRSASTCMS